MLAECRQDAGKTKTGSPGALCYCYVRQLPSAPTPSYRVGGAVLGGVKVKFLLPV